MAEKITLENGVRIVMQRQPALRSVALGVWVGSGSRFEPAELSGMSHFIEHMMFKGTKTRSAAEIAREMDRIGGGINAFTSKECTCYYIKTLDTHLDKGIDVLSDMLFHSLFADADIDLERGVIAEEIGMYEDSPEDVATEQLFESSYQGSGLGRPTLGTRETLAAIDSRAMHRYVAECYLPQRMVVSLAGSFTQADVDRLSTLFSAIPAEGRSLKDRAIFTPSIELRKKDTEQNHLCFGFPSITIGDERRNQLQMLNGILGGGMASRLFQSVREDHGLCYSIASFNSSHVDTGLLTIYTALGPATEEKALELIRSIALDFCKNGPTDEEIERVRDQILTNIYLFQESSDARMNQMGKSELFLGRVMPAEELIERYQAVTKDQITDLAREILTFDQTSFSAVGKIQTEERYKRYLV